MKSLLAALARADDGEGRQRLRALVFGLRRKLASGAARSPIETELRVGYRLAIEANEASPGGVDNEREGGASDDVRGMA